MGATQSTRKLSVNNDSPIHVSEAAMKRMTESEPTNVNNQITQAYPPKKEYKSEYDAKGGDDYWRKRIESLKKAHDAINEKMEEEYNKAITETAQMFKRAQTACVTGKLPPCLEYKAMVIKCYNENSTQPLLCAKYVNDFNDCVSSKRSEVMATGS